MPSIRNALRKVEMWPRPHSWAGSFSFEVDDSTIDTTIIPLAHYDEGKGAPDSYNSNPEHASYAVAAESNCFVDSRINNLHAEAKFSLTSKAYDDNIASIKVGVMPYFFSFKEDYDATDELSGSTVKSVLGMEYETTDRQGRPIFNGTDLAEKYTDSALLWDTTGLGLTVDTTAEGVTFSNSTYYNALQYMTIAGKMKKCQGGLKWFTLTQNRPVLKYKVHIRPKVKRMNEYTFLGLHISVPAQGTVYQHPVLTRDLTAATQYVDCDWFFRFLEWNDNFDHGKV